MVNTQNEYELLMKLIEIYPDDHHIVPACKSFPANPGNYLFCNVLV